MAKKLTERETTQELLQRMKDSAEHYDPDDWFGLTKEELEEQYKNFKQVSETLNGQELTLIYYLRNCRFGSTFRFVKIAKKLYEANQELEKIKNRL